MAVDDLDRKLVAREVDQRRITELELESCYNFAYLAEQENLLEQQLEIDRLALHDLAVLDGEHAIGVELVFELISHERAHLVGFVVHATL